VAQKPRDAVVNFFYRNLHRHRAVLPAIARLLLALNLAYDGDRNHNAGHNVARFFAHFSLFIPVFLSSTRLNTNLLKTVTERLKDIQGSKKTNKTNKVNEVCCSCCEQRTYSAGHKNVLLYIVLKLKNINVCQRLFETGQGVKNKR